MASTLANMQANELDKAVISYLSANNLSATAAALRTELNLGEDVFDEDTTKKCETLLEKKWTSSARLQRKVMELESRNQILESELSNVIPNSPSTPSDPSSWLPAPSSSRNTLESHQTAINCIAFHPIHSSIASGSDDCAIKVWDYDLGELERTLKGHTRAVLGVDYGGPRGGFLLASCGSDMTIRLWDPSNEYKNIRTLRGHDHSVSAVRFIPSGDTGTTTSGTLLASASRDKTIRMWDASTGYCLRTLRGHSEWIRDVYPSVDGRFLISTGDDLSGILWDVSIPNPEIKATVSGHEKISECCAFAPPSSYPLLARAAGLQKPPPASSSAEFIATGSRDKTIRLWDARGNCFMVLKGHENWVRALVFHPGGRYLLSASDDKSLRCWDLAQEGRCVRVLDGIHEHFVTCLRWAPGIEDGTAQPLDTESGGSDDAQGSANKVEIRCIIATGGADNKLRIFAN